MGAESSLESSARGGFGGGGRWATAPGEARAPPSPLPPLSLRVSPRLSPPSQARGAPGAGWGGARARGPAAAAQLRRSMAGAAAHLLAWRRGRGRAGEQAAAAGGAGSAAAAPKRTLGGGGGAPELAAAFHAILRPPDRLTDRGDRGDRDPPPPGPPSQPPHSLPLSGLRFPLLFKKKWIRTTEGVSQQIYSLPHLATLVLAQQYFKKSGRRGSNPRPSAWKANALSTELLPQFLVGKDGFEPPKA